MHSTPSARAIKQGDHGLARLALCQLQIELLPGPLVRLAWEQRVTERQALERLRFAFEGVDEVPVVEHPATTGAGYARAARQGEHQRPGEIAIQPVAVQPHLQALADQA